jgi:AAT family amino acid transporter/GABA permease
VISPELVFSFLVNASGALMLFVYFAVGLAQIIQRRRIEAEGREQMPIRMWLFPWLSYATLAAILSILVAMMFAPARRVELISSLVTLGIAAGFAWWRNRRA